tara:strand:+ start:1491 stop:2687 length:1197 start_codon:yes stop_codon:yes gene_type:complete
VDLHTNYISLYTGSGQLDKGFEQGLIENGFASPKPVCYVERDFEATALLVDKILAGEMGEAPIWTDSESFNCKPFVGKVDAIVGGFPCQPWSVAGRKEGEDDKRWLWEHIKRIVNEIRPKIIFLENVSGLISGGGLATVLSSLTEIGYDAKWVSLPASSVGASHRRERVFILAHPTGERLERWNKERNRLLRTGHSSRTMDDTEHNGCSTTKITGNTRQRSYNDKERSQETSQSKRSSERSNETNSLVNTNSKRRPRRNNGRENAMDVSSSGSRIYGKPRFAPAPNDPAWRDIIRHREDLSPALANYGKYNVENPSSFRWRRGNKGHEEVFYPDKTGRPGGEQKEIESEVRGMANGMGRKLDTIPKVGLLRYLGNGVVPLQATAAFTILYKEKTWKKT